MRRGQSIKQCIALFALALANAATAKPPRPGHASIAFADQPDGIRDWRVVDERTVYLQGNGNRWYRADLFQACFDLPYAQTLGFQTNPGGSFDETSAVIARGKRCPLKALTPVDGPPAKTVRDKH